MKNLTCTLVLLLGMSIMINVFAQPSNQDLFQKTALIRTTTAAGASVVMNQLEQERLSPDRQQELIEQMAARLKTATPLSEDQQGRLNAHLKKLEAQYGFAVHLSEMEMAKALFRADFDFDELLNTLSSAVSNHVNHQYSTHSMVSERHTPCASNTEGQTGQAPQYLSEGSPLPIYLSKMTEDISTIPVNGKPFRLHMLHNFPSATAKTDNRTYISWQNPFGQAESKIVEVIPETGGVPDNILTAVLSNKNDLGVHFSGYILIYNQEYSFEHGLAYEKGKLNSTTGVMVKRAPLTSVTNYAPGTYAAQQRLMVMEESAPIRFVPLNELCFQTTLHIQFPLEGSYLDISQY
ncbi:MAG: hypothetical protein HRU12_00200 [Phaeodactylibacter sp.]|nr:hypothetical protein [Phaeodactylibacter sp.]